MSWALPGHQTVVVHRMTAVTVLTVHPTPRSCLGLVAASLGNMSVGLHTCFSFLKLVICVLVPTVWVFSRHRDVFTSHACFFEVLAWFLPNAPSALWKVSLWQVSVKGTIQNQCIWFDLIGVLPCRMNQVECREECRLLSEACAGSFLPLRSVVHWLFCRVIALEGVPCLSQADWRRNVNRENKILHLHFSGSTVASYPVIYRYRCIKYETHFPNIIIMARQCQVALYLLSDYITIFLH